MMGELASREPDDRKPTPSQLRASHEDRDAVIEVLRVAAGDGRLTTEELDERLEIAFNARTYGELAGLTVDLPAGAMTAAALAPPPQVTPKGVVRIDCRSGHASRDGRWVLPKRIELKVSSGHVLLDLTEAVITHPVLDIAVEIGSGHLRIVTKPGVAVDTDDVRVRNGHVRVKAPWGPDIPAVLQVNVSGKIGSGHFLAAPKRRRRTFWQWLMRRPVPAWKGSDYPIGPGQSRGLSLPG
jgi:hypothetical protein